MQSKMKSKTQPTNKITPYDSSQANSGAAGGQPLLPSGEAPLNAMRPMREIEMTE